jgi:RND family efflux transporter MFP subunit
MLNSFSPCASRARSIIVVGAIVSACFFQLQMSHAQEQAPPGAPVQITPAQRQLLGVTSTLVTQTRVQQTIRTVGRIDFDERRLTDVTFKVGGWVQKLFVDATGKPIRKGDPLFTLYSPELVTTQQEYLLAVQTRARLATATLPDALTGAQALVEAARQRLLVWDLSPRQIMELEARGAPATTITMTSPSSGTVIDKPVQRGMRIEPGARVYRLADLSQVWLFADLHEPDIPLLREGLAVTLTLTAYPGETFTGTVDYVYPYLDPQTHTNTVRLVFVNIGNKLKPGMSANSELHIDVGSALTVPESAVLQSGQRNIVFIEKDTGMFSPREVTLGARAGNRIIVQSGLSPGERVAASSAFLLDSESKLQSAASMMGMMGAIGMGDWKMESARPMNMNTQTAQEKSSEKKVGALTITVSTAAESAKPGDNILRVQVKDSVGQPVPDAVVNLEYTMDMPGMAIEKSEARPVGNGDYEASVHFSMAGPWGVKVSVQQPGQAEVRVRFTIQVSKE